MHDAHPRIRRRRRKLVGEWRNNIASTVACERRAWTSVPAPRSIDYIITHLQRCVACSRDPFLVVPIPFSSVGPAPARGAPPVSEWHSPPAHVRLSSVCACAGVGSRAPAAVLADDDDDERPRAARSEARARARARSRARPLQPRSWRLRSISVVQLSTTSHPHVETAAASTDAQPASAQPQQRPPRPHPGPASPPPLLSSPVRPPGTLVALFRSLSLRCGCGSSGCLPVL
jgi:hypothetical protein